MKRTLTSKTVIVITAIVIILVVFSSLTTYTSPGPGQQYNSFAYGYGSNGTYSAYVNVENSYGTPIQNLTVSINLDNGSTIRSQTDPQGFAIFNLKNANNSDLGFSSIENAGVLQYFYKSPGNVTNYRQIVFYNNFSNPYFFDYTYANHANKQSRYYMTGFTDESKPYEQVLKIFYEGNLTTPSSKVDLYYTPINGTNNTNGGYSLGYGGSNLTKQNMTFSASYSDFTSLTLNLGNFTGSNVNFYVFELFTPNGTPIQNVGITTKTPLPSKQVSTTFFNNQMSIMGLFVPLMASLAAYNTFGKDRINGVLESTLSRPISRKGLITTRFVSTISALWLATFIALLISSLMYEFYLGRPLPTQTFLLGLWSLLVISAAYTSLVYLASNFIKSQGVLLGFVIGIFMVFDFFWAFSASPLIPLEVANLLHGTASGSFAYLRTFVVLYYISPAGLTNIASLLVTNTAEYVINIRSSLLATMGVTYQNMILVGLAWMVIPALISILVYRRKD